MPETPPSAGDEPVRLRLPAPELAAPLFPLVDGTSIPDTLCWDGPESFEEFRRVIERTAREVARGDRWWWCIEEIASGTPVGVIDFRPYAEEPHRGDIGLWVGEPFQGRGLGTAAVAAVLPHAFGVPGILKVEASAFVGNDASRRIFEKNGFRLEGTVRARTVKRGRPIDEWLLGLLREEWEAGLQPDP